MAETPENHAGRPHALDLDLPAAHSAVRMARSVLRRFAKLEGAPAREIETMAQGDKADNATLLMEAIARFRTYRKAGTAGGK